MKPYYEQDGITIYHGDCREILPSLTADAVITDPPYGVGENYASYEDSPSALSALLSNSLPLIRASAPVALVTTGTKHLWLYPKPDWTMCWFVRNGSGVGPWGFVCWHPIVAYGSDPYSGKGSRPDGFEYLPAREPTFNHPCSKPLRVMTWLVNRGSSSESETILDPFMGSGTTLRAAKDLGRKAIGIEIEERYCEIAARRMSQRVLDFAAVS